MRLFLISLCTCIGTTFLMAAPSKTLQDGELFRFKAGWGVFTHAGEITVKSHRDTLNGKPVLRVSMTTETKGFISGIFKYENKAEAFIDESTGRLVQATEVAHNGDKHTDALDVFDYEKHKVTHTDKAHPDRNQEMDIPTDGDPVDLLSALIGARSWARTVGTKRDTYIFASRDIYPVTITAESLETIRWKDDDVQALMLVPRMEKCAPRGVFKRGGEMKVWVAQSGDYLPVRMQLKLPIGTATLTLIEYTREGAASTPVAKN